MVRGTTRDPALAPEIESAGAEAFIGDPDVVGTLVPAFLQVSAVCILLGSAAGDPEQLAALHGTRLEMLLQKLIDTTARGVVYEAAGSVPRSVLDAGADAVRQSCERSRIPYGLITADPGDFEAWLDSAMAGFEAVLT